jgi:hypothetical protein
MHSHHASDPQDDQGTDLAYHGDSLLNSLHSAYVVLFLPLFLRHTFSLPGTGKNKTVQQFLHECWSKHNVSQQKPVKYQNFKTAVNSHALDTQSL